MVYSVYYALASIMAVLLSLHRTIHLPDYLYKNILLIGGNPFDAFTPSTVDNIPAAASHISKLDVSASSSLRPVPNPEKPEILSNTASAAGTLPAVEQHFSHSPEGDRSQDIPGLHGIRNVPPMNPVLVASLGFIVPTFVLLWVWIRSPSRIHERYFEQADTEMRDFITEVQQLKGRLLGHLDLLHLLVDEQSHDVLHRFGMGDYGYQSDGSEYFDHELSSLEEQEQAEYDLRLSLWLRPDPDVGSEDDDTSSFDLQSDTPDIEPVIVQPLSIVKASASEVNESEGDIGADDCPPRWIVILHVDGACIRQHLGQALMWLDARQLDIINRASLPPPAYFPRFHYGINAKIVISTLASARLLS
ncbi:hypothetical protein BJX96DRAFT_168285 [Aspergillus floccosus]